MASLPDPFAHLLTLGDDVAVLEHAEGAVPRRRHGYCVDDAARLVVAVAREPAPSRGARALGGRCLAMLQHAVAPDGTCHNRMGYDRRWCDEPGVGDWWGRALWALGVGAASGWQAAVRTGARLVFERAVRARSPHRRAMAYASLGAAAVCEHAPGHPGAVALLRDAAEALGRPPSGTWRWPEPALAYANALLPEALIAVGAALGQDRLVGDGCDFLDWLVGIETRGDHLSVTPVGGWAPGEPRPGFDQQPIELCHLADACARALAVTGDRRWVEPIRQAAAWFLGANDVGLPLADPETGGCRDGLERDGVNVNEGAESTLALVLTWQHARRLGIRPLDGASGGYDRLG